MAETASLEIPHIVANQDANYVTANTAFDSLDGALAGLLAVDCAGSSDVTLTDAQALLNMLFNCTGVLTGNISLIVPVNTKLYSILNNTTGSFTLTCKVSGQTGILVPQGESVLLYCDGTDVEQLDTVSASETREGLIELATQAEVDAGSDAVRAITPATLNAATTVVQAASAFTQGSVLFADSGGAAAQDNANLFWDDTNNRLGIGTASPSTPLHVTGADASVVLTVGNTTESTRLEVDTYQDDRIVVRATDTADTARHFCVETGTTERLRIGSAGSVYIGDTANANMTVGLTINQGANDNEILALKSSDVAHGMTNFAETDSYGTFGKGVGASGGLLIRGFNDGAFQGCLVQSAQATADGTKSTAGIGAIQLDGRLISGTTSATLGADNNILVIADNNTTRFILDADGDSHQDIGTAWTNFDAYDDTALLTTLSAAVSQATDPVKNTFRAYLDEHRATLEALKIVTFNSDGHHFINWSRTHMLVIGAVRQLGERLDTLEHRLLTEG